MCSLKKCCTTAMMLFALGANVPAAAVILQPLVSGEYRNGDGANSQWAQVAGDWRGPTYGSESWGTGLWGITDALQILALAPADPALVNVHSGRVDQINFADLAFLNAWGASWGTQQLAPFFSNDPAQYQDNYAVRFSGYISILAPGTYNFGVLYDDGFNFTLAGANSSLSIARDGLNPRDRLGFDEDLMLDAGLYGYELLGYERLEAGVVNLAWARTGSAWETVPQAHLFTTIPTSAPMAVPEPSTWPLLVFGLAIFSAMRAARQT